MQDDEERSPRRKVEEAGDVASQCNGSGPRHQEQREQDREQRVEHYRQHDIEDRDPFHRVVRDRRIGPLGLNIGPGLREDVDAAGATRSCKAMHGLVHGIDRQHLAENVARAARDAGEILVSNRQIGHELGLGERFGLSRIELASRDKRHLVNEARPLPRQRGVGFAAGDDRGRHAVVGLPGHEFLRARRAARCDRRPDIVALGQLLHRVAAEQQIVEHALPDMLIEVRSKLRIGNAQAARRFEQPRAIDHAVLRVVEVVRQPEDELGRAGQIVPRLAGETCHKSKPERDIGYRCRRKAGIDPVGHMDVHARHHQAHVDERRT